MNEPTYGDIRLHEGVRKKINEAITDECEKIWDEEMELARKRAEKRVNEKKTQIVTGVVMNMVESMRIRDMGPTFTIEIKKVDEDTWKQIKASK